MRPRNAIAAGLLLLLLARRSVAQQQQDEISSDRPSVGTSASTVGADNVQLETGAFWQREDGQDITIFPTLLRVGTGQRWEIRLESDLLQLSQPGLDSFADVSLGAKVNFYDRDSTKLGLLMNLNIPAGNEEVRGSLDPELTFLWDQDLGKDWTLNLNAGVALSEQGDRFLQLNWAIGIQHALGQRVDLYLEYFGEGPDEPAGDLLTGADAGLMWRLTEDLQLDASYARGLSSHGLDWGAGFGVSARF
jgi:hypothetical protein